MTNGQNVPYIILDKQGPWFYSFKNIDTHLEDKQLLSYKQAWDWPVELMILLGDQVHIRRRNSGEELTAK